MTAPDDLYREVMTADPPAAGATGPWSTDLWSSPALSRRERRWITLATVGFDTDQQAMDDHVYAALNSGDLTLEEMHEFILHFAVYCGWPKASRMEQAIRDQRSRIAAERGEELTDLPDLPNDSLGESDWELRLQRGAECFAEVNLVPAPARNTPYQQAGILGFVFGHLWQRPGLSRRDRRFITVPCVGVELAPMPILSHVGSAVHSGDLTRPEMDELVRHYTAYAGDERGAVLAQAVQDDVFGQFLNKS